MGHLQVGTTSGTVGYGWVILVRSGAAGMQKVMQDDPPCHRRVEAFGLTLWA